MKRGRETVPEKEKEGGGESEREREREREAQSRRNYKIIKRKLRNVEDQMRIRGQCRRGKPAPSNGLDHLQGGGGECGWEGWKIGKGRETSKGVEYGGRGPDVLMSASLRTHPLRMTISSANLRPSDKKLRFRRNKLETVFEILLLSVETQTSRAAGRRGNQRPGTVFFC